MKKKILILATVVALVCVLVVPTAALASPGTADYAAAVTAAADRLAANQNADGGFGWWTLANPPPQPSATNILGITAMGILKAYELEEKPSYETALAKAYKYAVDKPPTYAGGVETVKGVDSCPDVTFMIWLAQAAADDVSLLGAIQTQVPGTTAASIATLAKDRWDGRLVGINGGSATGMAESIRDLRHGQGWDTLIPWDLEFGVKAALALDDYYPGEGYNTQAINIVTVIYNSVDDAEGVYFNSGDTTQEDYIAGLTGAIEAFVEVGLYQEKVSALKALLIDAQQPGGYWNYYGNEPTEMSVQNTAYAVMALLRQGESDAVAAAQKGAGWLESSQNTDGGWLAEGGVAPENLEVNSEAAWAIKMVLDSLSASVGMTAAYTPRIGISVNPTSVDFGAVVPGIPSDPRTVNVTNYGNVDVDLSASVINESPPGVYTGTPGLTIDGTAVLDWESYLTPESGVPCTLMLTAPDGTPSGTYTATLVFWAEAP